jgi:phosphatidylglycerophosphate synthase
VAANPWDSRLARRLILPLGGTRLTPNHVTTAGLLVGLVAAVLYARGDRAAANLGAALYCLSAILDHADGELARLTGRTSALGHVYDRVADLVVKISLFAGMGLGLRHGPLGRWAAGLGAVAGIAFVAIFLLRSALARRLGPAELVQPSAGPFEIEDILYVIAPITWLGWLQPFVVAVAVGAPLFALWVASRLWTLRSVVPGGKGVERSASASP